MTTVGAFAQQIQRRLQSRHRPKAIVLAASITDTATTTVTVDGHTGGTTDKVLDNHLLELPTSSNVEELLVVDKGTDSDVTVIRGFNGTSTAAADNGSHLFVAPPYPLAGIIEDMQAEIESWPRHVFDVGEVELTFGPTDKAVNLTAPGTTPHFILSSRWRTSAYRDDEPEAGATLLRNRNTSDYASGYSVEVPHSPQVSSTLRVVYAKSFDVSTFDFDTDLQTTVNLTEALLNVLRYGTMQRQLEQQEAHRTDLSGLNQSRNPADAPPAAAMQTALYYRTMRNETLAEEQLRLRGQWNYRRVAI